MEKKKKSFDEMRDNRVAEFYKKERIVDTKPAFYKSVREELSELQKMIVPIDYSTLEFDDELDNYNLSNLSPEAVAKIILIIKEDEQIRGEKILEQLRIDKNLEAQKLLRIKNGGWTSEDSTLKLPHDKDYEIKIKSLDDDN